MLSYKIDDTTITYNIDGKVTSFVLGNEKLLVASNEATNIVIVKECDDEHHCYVFSIIKLRRPVLEIKFRCDVISQHQRFVERLTRQN